MKPSIRWLIRLVFLAVVAWYFAPLYTKPDARRPAADAPIESVHWTVHSTTTNAILQELTLYADGRSAVRWVRAPLDNDLPENLARWRPRRDKSTGLTEFRHTNVVDAATARALIATAITEGLLRLEPLPVPEGPYLEIGWTTRGGAARTVRGPVDLTRTFDWNRSVWYRQQRWQAVSTLVTRHGVLGPLLEKRTIELVDDHGSPVAPAP